jgi:hypothetical protein
MTSVSKSRRVQSAECSGDGQKAGEEGQTSLTIKLEEQVVLSTHYPIVTSICCQKSDEKVLQRCYNFCSST